MQQTYERTKYGIPTEYEGTWFRSRLEVRWVIFLNELGIAWRYEPKTFKFIHNGQALYYKPDFYLPLYSAWAEVKPTELEPIEDTKCRFLCTETRQTIITLIGVPSSTKMSAYYVDIKNRVRYKTTASWTNQVRWNGESITRDEINQAIYEAQNYKFDDSLIERDILFSP